MADFAPNYTPRFRTKYSVSGATHHMTVRVARGVTDFSGIATKIGAVLDAFAAGILPDFTILGADAALTDSDVFLPVDPPAFGGGEADASGLTSAIKAVQMSFPGRGSGGTRSIVYLYGTAFAPNVTTAIRNDFRITSAENADVAAAITAWSELAPSLVANDGTPVSFYSYVNIKYNDHWVRKARQG